MMPVPYHPTAPVSGFAPAPASSPIQQQPFKPNTPSVQTLNVETFQFEFMANGSAYKAVISYEEVKGASIELYKSVGGQWITSSSRLQYGIMGAFVFQHAYNQMMLETAAKGKDEK